MADKDTRKPWTEDWSEGLAETKVEPWFEQLRLAVDSWAKELIEWLGDVKWWVYELSKRTLSNYISSLMNEKHDPDSAKAKLVILLQEYFGKEEVSSDEILNLEVDWENFADYFAHVLSWTKEFEDSIKLSTRDFMAKNFLSNLKESLNSNWFPSDDASIKLIFWKDISLLSFDDFRNVDISIISRNIFQLWWDHWLSLENINSVISNFSKNFGSFSINDYLKSIWVSDSTKWLLKDKISFKLLVDSSEKELRLLTNLFLSQVQSEFEKKYFDMPKNDNLINSLNGDISVYSFLDSELKEFYELVKSARTDKKVSDKLWWIDTTLITDLVWSDTIDWELYYECFVSFIGSNYSSKLFLLKPLLWEELSEDDKKQLFDMYSKDFTQNYNDSLKAILEKILVRDDINVEWYISNIFSEIKYPDCIFNIIWTWKPKEKEIKAKVTIDYNFEWDNLTDIINDSSFKINFEINPEELPWKEKMAINIDLNWKKQQFYKGQLVKVQTKDWTIIEDIILNEHDWVVRFEDVDPLNIEDITDIDVIEKTSSYSMNDILKQWFNYYTNLPSWDKLDLTPVDPTVPLKPAELVEDKKSDEETTTKTSDSSNELKPEEKYALVNQWYQAFQWFGSKEFWVWSIFYFSTWKDDSLKVGKDSLGDMWNNYHKIFVKKFDKVSWDITVIESSTVENWTVEKKFNIYTQCFEWNDFTLFSNIEKSFSKPIKFTDWIKDLETFKKFINWNDIKSAFSKFDDQWKFRIDSLKDVKYIWKKTSASVKWKKADFWLFFDVSFENWHVVLNGNWYNRKLMPYDEFLVFMADKWLEPFTEDSRKNFEESFEQSDIKSKKIYSPLWIILTWITLPLSLWILSMKMAMNPKEAWKTFLKETGLDKVLEEYKAKKKLKQSLEDAESYAKLAKTLWTLWWWIPWIWDTLKDLKNETQWQVTSKKKQIVNDYVDRLKKSWWHGKDAAKYIYNTIISSDSKAEKIFNKDPLKWLAAFQYSMENWWMYFRDLASAAWTGRWVLVLLWPSHYEKFKKQRELLLNAAKKWTEKDKKDLALFEMRYIYKNISEDTYYTWIWWQLEWYLNRFNEDTQGGYNSQKDKDFFEVHSTAYQWLFKWAVLGRWMWAQKVMVEKTFDGNEYNALFGSMTFYSIISHVHLSWIDPDYMESLATSTWFDLVFKAQSSTYWPNEVAKLIDEISKSAWISKDWFIKDIAYDYNDLLWSNYHTNAYELMQRFNKWWWNNWTKVIDILTMRDGWKIFDYAKDSARINEYLTSSSSSNFSWPDYIDNQLWIKWRSYIENNVWHYTPWMFKYCVADLHEWRYHGKSVEMWDKMWWFIWKWFSEQIKKYKEISNDSDKKEYRRVFWDFFYNRLKTRFVKSARFNINEQVFEQVFWPYFGKWSMENRSSFINNVMKNESHKKWISWSSHWETSDMSCWDFMLDIIHHKRHEIPSNIVQAFSNMDKLLDIIKNW